MTGNQARICFLIRRAVGGMQTHVLQLLTHLDRQAFRPTVISPPNARLESAVRDLDVPFISIDMSDSLGPADVMTVARLTRELRRLRPDVLHIHGNKAALVGRPAARLAKVPSVVITVHNFLVYQTAGTPVKQAAGWAERFLAGWTDRIITVSDSLKANLVAVEGLPPEKIITIHNGIDLSSRNERRPSGGYRERLGLNGDRVIASIGRFVPFKGYGVLLDSVAQVLSEEPNARFLIAGDGPLRQELEDKRRALGLEKNVFFLGFVDDPEALLAEADIFVLPSLNEPFGIAILEAMASGLPVIATRAGGVPEIITNGENGVLVEPGDSVALGHAIVSTLSDRAMAGRLVASAGRTLAERFSVQRMAEATQAVYRECLGRRAG